MTQMNVMRPERALVLFSGGQDSTTCLAWALARFAAVETVGFDYGQRHRVELDAARAVVAAAAPRLSANGATRLGDDHSLDLSVSGPGQRHRADPRHARSSSSKAACRTPSCPAATCCSSPPPRRSAIGAASRHLVGGMCETDFSGYPDCRDDTLKALQATLSLGMDQRFVIHTPLMWLDKAATWALAEELGGEALVDLILEETPHCYHGDRSAPHDWGYGCGACPACDLRAKGVARG